MTIVLFETTAPRAILFRDFLSEAECQHLIQTAAPRVTRSTTVNHETGGNTQSAIRTSASCAIGRHENDPVVARIQQEMIAMTGIPVENFEEINITRYNLSEQYVPHFDAFDPVFEGARKVISNGGQRFLTLICYLCDVEDGGETIFPECGLQITPKRGNALMFYSCEPDTDAIDPKSLHGGLPVLQGEKWIATQWVRKGAFDPRLWPAQAENIPLDIHEEIPQQEISKQEMT